ncbi:hypothetical protein LOD99_15525 [Oopsacas minuta]|uniref:Uncharacterized protein n=1 Tax=Oopsacas minuta TaxID=111878 RepID=A0AAV7KD50_9METZ|nr:hypothetical protein LOD99_15525 [Oopsacas minuta]
MPKRCRAYNRQGKDIGEPYTPLAQRLHQMLKFNIIPQGCLEWKCSYCTAPIVLEDIDVMLETSTEDTQTFLDSTDTLKHKVVFIAGFLTYKHLGPGEGDGGIK